MLNHMLEFTNFSFRDFMSHGTFSIYIEEWKHYTTLLAK